MSWPKWPMVVVNMDESEGYHGFPGMGRSRSAVFRADREWGRVDVGDRIRKEHVDTLERTRTGMREFPGAFRGVSKKYLYQYVAMFGYGYNTKRARPVFLLAILGLRSVAF